MAISVTYIELWGEALGYILAVQFDIMGSKSKRMRTGMVVR